MSPEQEKHLAMILDDSVPFLKELVSRAMFENLDRRAMIEAYPELNLTAEMPWKQMDDLVTEHILHSAGTDIPRGVFANSIKHPEQS